MISRRVPEYVNEVRRTDSPGRWQMSNVLGISVIAFGSKGVRAGPPKRGRLGLLGSAGVQSDRYVSEMPRMTLAGMDTKGQPGGRCRSRCGLRGGGHSAVRLKVAFRSARAVSRPLNNRLEGPECTTSTRKTYTRYRGDRSHMLQSCNTMG